MSGIGHGGWTTQGGSLTASVCTWGGLTAGARGLTPRLYFEGGLTT
jgi:hypothetical protein